MYRLRIGSIQITNRRIKIGDPMRHFFHAGHARGDPRAVAWRAARRRAADDVRVTRGGFRQ